MIGLSGSALWGLSLFDAAEPYAAVQVAITAAAPADRGRRDAPEVGTHRSASVAVNAPPTTGTFVSPIRPDLAGRGAWDLCGTGQDLFDLPGAADLERWQRPPSPPHSLGETGGADRNGAERGGNEGRGGMAPAHSVEAVSGTPVTSLTVVTNGNLDLVASMLTAAPRPVGAARAPKAAPTSGNQVPPRAASPTPAPVVVAQGVQSPGPAGPGSDGGGAGPGDEPPPPGAITPFPPNTPPDPPQCSKNGSPVQDGAGVGGDSNPSKYSTSSVRYFDGVVQLAWTDLRSDGFGAVCDQRRSWSNGRYNPLDGLGRSRSDNGSGMVVEQLPYLTGHAAHGPDEYVITNATSARIYDGVDNDLVPRFYTKDQLTFTSGEYVLTDTAGNQIHFYDTINGPFDPRWGKFKSMIDPAGNVTAVTRWTADGKAAEVQRSTPAGQTPHVVESFVYSYGGSGSNQGLIKNVTLRRQVDGGNWTVVRQVDYTYYATGEANGNPTDLKTATVEDAAGTALDTTYYRYWPRVGSGQGIFDGLKYVVNPQSYARLAAAVSDPLQATDQDLAPYADNFFQYDSQNRVIKEVAQGTSCSCAADGGLGTFLYSYSTSNVADADYNTWRYKTVETMPDNSPTFVSRNIVYTNSYGEVMLKVYESGTPGHTQQWDTFYKYDNAGRVILQADPSAVTGFSESAPDLLNFSGGRYQFLRDHDGKIQLTDYYPATTATEAAPGGVAGYFQDSKLQQGQLGTPVLQSSKQYIARTGNRFDVTVTTPGGTSAANATARFTYVPPPLPVVTGFNQSSASVLGGTPVLIAGTGLTGATHVNFGTAPASFTVLSDTTIRVTVPPHAAGAIDVTVVTPAGTSAVTAADRFTFVSPPAPVVTGLSRTTGDIFGGVTMAVIGTHFTGATQVTVGGTAASVSTISDTAISFSTPARATAGMVDVRVTTPGGTSAITPADQFTYMLPPRPTVTGLSLTSDTTLGGAIVTILGTALTGATAVSFGGTPGTGITVNSDTSVTVHAPMRPAGVVDVTVTTPGGTSAITTADRFTYALPPAPVLTGLAPRNGSIAGGTRVTIVGANFAPGATTVSFDSLPGSAVSVLAPSLLTVLSPAHAAGVVDVTVTTPGGTSAITPADQFTYTTSPMDPPMPVVVGLSPASGSARGNTFVTIVGTGFTGASRVTFGSTPATITQVSTYFVTVWTPAEPPGVVDVRVTTPQGTSDITPADRFTYVAPPMPVVTGLSLTTGTTVGGVGVTVIGTGFTDATQVIVGGTVFFLSSISDTALSFRTPARATAGVVDVRVTTPGGTSDITPADRFTYVLPPRPVVTGLSPTTGTTLGGVSIAVIGTDLGGVTQVAFGGAAASMSLIADTALIVNTPVRATAGVVDVAVTTPGGTSDSTAADRFTYTLPPQPVVTVIGPTSESSVNLSRVTILGSGFTGATRVAFGGTVSSSISISSDAEITAEPPAELPGTVDITVIAPGGTSAITAADQFTYVRPPEPVVTGVGAATGTTPGGNLVTVIGSGFTGANFVSFGGTPGTGVTVLSDSALTVQAPAHDKGTVDVTVATPGGTSSVTTADQYTYVAPDAPVVVGLGPSQGLSSGGYLVTVIGTGLSGATAVSFGGTPGTGIRVVSDNALTVAAPRHDLGTVDVTVTTPGGTSDITPTDQFAYVTDTGTPGPPVVTGLSPNQGVNPGSATVTTVTIIGSGFSQGLSSVVFGTTPTRVPPVLSDNAVMVQVPAHDEGVVDVRVTTTRGTSDITSADRFTYVIPPPPVVAELGVTFDTTLGGTTMAILGSGFTGASDVSFGVTSASSFTVLSDNAIRVRVPPHPLDTIYPVASATIYRNTDGTGAETTQYAYTWYPGTARMQSMTVTKPTISAAQNGPGTPDVETTVYDVYGRPIWTRDADGFIRYMEYDQGTGAVTKSIVDVDTTRTSDFQNLPAGWITPPGGGLHLVTQMGVDGLGRETQRVDPNGNITYTVYNDANHEKRVYPGWNADTGLPTGPTQVWREDRAHSPSYVETLTMSAVPNVGDDGRPDGSEPMNSVESLSRIFTSPGGQVIEKDAYFSLAGVDYATDPYLGQAGTNYYPTTYGYDDQGRRNQVVLPTGTIDRTVYDGLGRVVSTWVGTNDMPADGGEWSPDDNTPPANMVQLTANVYDYGGVGDGNLTQQTQLPGGGAAPRVTQNFFDWRDRLVASKQGVQASENDGTHRPITYAQYDNLDEIVSQERYDGDGINITITNGVPDRPPANRLRAKTTTAYDDQGRVFRTDTYSVNQMNGTISTTSLVNGTWYNHRGLVIKTVQPGRLVVKNHFDGAGRLVANYATDGLGDATWADANTVANNNVLSQTETQYDADGNPVFVTSRQRFHDETQHGELGIPTSANQAKARAAYLVSYYDAANRLTDRVDVGTNGGTVYVRPDSVPAGSDTVLVTHTDYDSAGRVRAVTDPRGLVTRTTYDLLGRTVQTIAAFTGDGTPTENTNQTTAYTYDGANHILTLTAVLPGGVTQTTQYFYGITDPINSNDLLAQVIYPDNGLNLAENYGYNALGQLVSKTDRNGTTHAYTYDVLGRQTADAVTALADGVDGQVLRLETAYDTGGRPFQYTSYDDAVAGHIVNQVRQDYNGLGQLITEYQAHGGAVDPMTTSKVQYAYSEMANGVNHSRLVSMTYPDGTVLRYNYGAGVDDAISRLTSLSDNTGILEAYHYLGLNTVVIRSHPQPGVDLTYVKQPGEPNGDAGDQYTGLDRFGRVVDQRWLVTSDGSTTDRFQYGYDPDGNRLYRNNRVNAAFGELYEASGTDNGYDLLNRLTDFARGTLNDSHDAVVGTPSRSQSWSLDALGNWESLTSDGTTQSRDHNAQNQIADVDGNPLAYDNNGNLTTDDAGQGYTYDAWNRLVAVQDLSGTPLASYAYDAMGRRIIENSGTAVDLYFSKDWQVLEEHLGAAAQAHYVWSPAYVDALVLRDRGSERLYVQQDANWDVTALVDASGTVQERYIYDPYGQFTVLTPDWAVRGTSAHGWIYLHQGGRYDYASGLYDFRHREYSPTLGRWMQQDPLGNSAGMDLYEYVRSNPLIYLDWTGMDNPGCDLPRCVKSPRIVGDCELRCCAQHDQCYADNGCGAVSWLVTVPFGRCDRCNIAVEACFLRCKSGVNPPTGPRWFCPNGPFRGRFYDNYADIPASCWENGQKPPAR
jgi:RHS repeat-associated protein